MPSYLCACEVSRSLLDVAKRPPRLPRVPLYNTGGVLKFSELMKLHNEFNVTAYLARLFQLVL